MYKHMTKLYALAMREEAAIYLEVLVKKACEANFEPDDAFIQTGMYLLSSALGANLGFNFKLCLGGLYSEEVDALDDYLVQRGEAIYNLADVKPEIMDRVERVIAFFEKAREKFAKYYTSPDFEPKLWGLLGMIDYIIRCSYPETDEDFANLVKAFYLFKTTLPEPEEDAGRLIDFVYEELWNKP